MLVNVLISTYNGEKYITEQIESILKQTYPNIKIWIRDDGSSDATMDIIQKNYADNVTLIPGKNVGFGRSFYQLLAAAEPGDLWAFCDQDDVWEPQKIEWAVEWMQRKDQQLPLLFHSAFAFYSGDLSKKTGEYLCPNQKLDFRRSLTDCLYQGFSMVINRAERELILKCEEEKYGSHDWMAMLIAVSFGESYFDNRIASKHRRLDESLSGLSWKNRLKWFYSMFFTESNTKKTLCEFERKFGAELSCEKERKMLSRFTGEKYSLTDSLYKAFYPARWRPNLLSEVAVRILMLLGKI